MEKKKKKEPVRDYHLIPAWNPTILLRLVTSTSVLKYYYYKFQKLKLFFCFQSICIFVKYGLLPSTQTAAL